MVQSAQAGGEKTYPFFPRLLPQGLDMGVHGKTGVFFQVIRASISAIIPPERVKKPVCPRERRRPYRCSSFLRKDQGEI